MKSKVRELAEYQVAFLLLAIVFLSGCTHLFYYPLEEHSGYLQQSKINAEEGYLTTEDNVKINYWYISFLKNKSRVSDDSIKKLTQPKGLFLQFHGNAQNMSYHFANIIWVIEHGYDLMVFDYRGYGKSQKESTSPKGTFWDSQVVLAEADRRAPNNTLFTYGQSLGGSVLLNALATGKKPKNLKGVIIESSFYSYQDTAKEKLSNFWLFWPFQWLAYLLINDDYSPANSNLKSISPTPVYLFHSVSDPVVNHYNLNLIFNDLENPKKKWDVQAPGHINSMWVEKGLYRKALLNELSTIQ